MSYQLSVLRAMVRLARRRFPITLEHLAIRVGGEASDVRAALRELAAVDLVVRTSDGVGARLTMSGLAIALASNCARQRLRPRVLPRAIELPIPRRRSRAA